MYRHKLSMNVLDKTGRRVCQNIRMHVSEEMEKQHTDDAYCLRPQNINNDASRSKLSRYCSANTKI